MAQKYKSQAGTGLPCFNILLIFVVVIKKINFNFYKRYKQIQRDRN